MVTLTLPEMVTLSAPTDFLIDPIYMAKIIVKLQLLVMKINKKIV